MSKPSHRRKSGKPEPPPIPELPPLPDEAWAKEWFNQTPAGRICRAIEKVELETKATEEAFRRRYQLTPEKTRAAWPGITDEEIAQQDKEDRQELQSHLEEGTRLEVLGEFDRIVQEYADREHAERAAPVSWDEELRVKMRSAQVAAEKLPDVQAVRWALAEYLHSLVRTLRRAGQHAAITGFSADLELAPPVFISRLDGFIAHLQKPHTERIAAPAAEPTPAPGKVEWSRAMQKKEIAGLLGISVDQFNAALEAHKYHVDSINRQLFRLRLDTLSPEVRKRFDPLLG